MTAVGPPDWPMTALPETRSGTVHSFICGAHHAPGERTLASFPVPSSPGMTSDKAGK
jgi:hypothetical protein